MRGAYQQRLAAEIEVYDRCLQVHDLPPIFHYWSNRYVRPMFRRFGFDDIKDIFRDYLEKQCGVRPDQRTDVISIGSGNCDFEVELASHLRALGHHNFVLGCLDLNSTMLERGRAAAEQAGVGGHMDFVQGDFNDWVPGREYDAVIANQALHHVLKLEHLFAQIKQSLKPDGTFIISDMIGRNGHQRWPEALEIVQEFWGDLPPSYRFNRALRRYQEVFENWDCSLEGFEGIRSQDILPLLMESFQFHLFLPFGNVIDPFTDRPFGFNFDAEAPWDQAFIDRVQQRDEQEMVAGRIKPTHMLAVLGNRPCAAPILIEPLTPSFCVRPPGELRPASKVEGVYRWDAWPHSTQTELEIACRRLKEGDDKMIALESEVQARTAWARGLEQKLDERTAWVLRIEGDLKDRTQWALDLEEELRRLKALIPELRDELENRTRWARRLETQVTERTDWAQRLDHTIRESADYISSLETEVHERTSWARTLEAQFQDRAAWAKQLESEKAQLEAELFTYIHNPFRYLLRLARGVFHRVRRLASYGPPRK